MKTHHHHHQQQHQEHPKLKNPPRSLFSCGIFGHCTETVLSPTNHQTPTLPPPPTPPVSDPQPPPSHPQPPPPPQPESESTTSSSSSTSQSFTQWRFQLPSSPMKHNPPSESRPQIADNNPNPPPETSSESNALPPFPTSTTTNVNLEELFHIAELQFSSGSESSKLSALHLLERSLVPNPQSNVGGNHPTTCPPPVMAEVVRLLKDPLGGKPATKVLLALCLSEGNRHVAVEAGAVLEVIEALAELEGAAAERALAALELLCTVAEGAAELKAHALAVPMLIEAMRKMEGRGKECAVSVLAVIFSGGGEEGFAAEAPEEVGRAVVLALQGECSARGRRKGAQLLKILQENGRLDLTEDGMR